MSQTPYSAADDRPPAGADPGPGEDQDVLESMREQLMSISAGDLVAESAVPLLTLAYARLGVPPEQNAQYRDLQAARLLIDALGGMLDAVRGQLGAVEPELRDALTNLRMAYVDVTEHADDAHDPAGAAGAPATRPGPERAADRPSGLWVPGRP